VRNRTILCSAGSHENLDTKSSPICRVAINVPPCLVATKQSTAKYHKTHIYSTKTVENGGTASKMKAIFEMLRRVVTLTNVITDTGNSIILLLIYFVSVLTFTIRFA